MEQTLKKSDTIWNKDYVSIIIANFMLCLGHASINPLVATYTQYLKTTAEMTGFLTGMFFIVAFACHPFAGPAMTKLDKRKLLIFVFLIGAVANVGYALFHSVPMFIVFRVFSGLQYSLVGPLLMALCADHLPKEKLAYGLGMYGIGGAIANAVAPYTGSAILTFGTSLGGEGMGFTVLFSFGALMMLLAIIPTCRIAPDIKTKEELAGTGAWYKNIFTIHALPITIVITLLMISYSTVNTYMFNFTNQLGIAKPDASVFYLVMAGSLAVSRPMSGFLTNRFGVARIVIPALGLFTAAMFIIGASSQLWMLLVCAVLVAVGFGSSQPSIQAMGLQSEPALKRGVVTNTLYMGMDLGLFLGPTLGGFVYSASKDYGVMYKSAVIPVALAIICFIFFLPLHRRRAKELEDAPQL